MHEGLWAGRWVFAFIFVQREAERKTLRLILCGGKAAEARQTLGALNP